MKIVIFDLGMVGLYDAALIPPHDVVLAVDPPAQGELQIVHTLPIAGPELDFLVTKPLYLSSGFEEGAADADYGICAGPSKCCVAMEVADKGVPTISGAEL